MRKSFSEDSWSVCLAFSSILASFTWLQAESLPWYLISLSFLLISYIIFPITIKEHLTLADYITLFRFTLVIGMSYLIVVKNETNLLIQLIIILAILLDGVDGFCARRFGSSTSGALLDMEADSIITLVLCLISVHIFKLPLWICMIGLWRSVYVLLCKFNLVQSRIHPKSSLFGKSICVITLSVLIFNLSPNFSLESKIIPSLIALVLISISFLRGIQLVPR